MKKQLHTVGILLTVFMIIMLTACNGKATVDLKKSEQSGNISSDNTESVNEISDAINDDTSQVNVNESSQESGGSDTSVNSQTSETHTDNISKEHQHSYTSKVIKPTCTAQGYTLNTCSCGENEKHTFTDALGHNWGEWTTVKAATQSSTGLQRRTCLRCSANEEKVLEKLPQTAENWYQEILRLVNIEREKMNLKPLQYYYTGQSAADIRATEIKTKFSHIRPNGQSCFTALDELGIGYRSAGENIAYGYTSPQAVMQGWMNSEGHRNNILNANFTHIIVGIDGTHWVQLFLKL